MIPRSSRSLSHDESLLRERRIQQEENESSTTASDNESNLQQQQQRSSPIAIIGRQKQPSQTQQQSGGDGGNNNNIAAMNEDDSSDLDDDDDDDDDNNSNDVDVVERDAKQLQRKYGGMTMVQTYQPPSSAFLATHPTRQQQHQQTRSTAATNTTSSALNAPYLGSRHRSPNQVLSLPPMSLAGDTHTRDYNYNNISGNEEEEEPPESIGGTFFAYGSLRDSHERGRFLDGPSSYREPTSGKIRQLDHRLRYHGTGSSHHQLSIGERMQQSRKLKEIRQRMEQQQGRKEPEYDQKHSTTTTTSQQQQSSLSAMMNEATKHQSLSSRDETVGVADTTLSLGGEMTLMPSITDDMPTIFDLDQQEQQQEREFRMDTPYMLSTSMTALEMLRMSNISSNFNALSLNPSLMSSSIQQQQQHHPPTSLSTTTSATIPGVAVLSSTTATTTVATQNVVPGSDADHHQHIFQPLARSMSDPTPRWQHQQPQRFLRNHASKPNTTATAAAAAGTGNIWTTTTTTIAHHHPHHHSISPGFVPSQHSNNNIQQQQHQQPSPSYGYAVVAPQQPDHDPDTDGAFGDLDME